MSLIVETDLGGGERSLSGVVNAKSLDQVRSAMRSRRTIVGKAVQGEAVSAAAREMDVGLGRSGTPTFYVKALVRRDSLASRGVAATVILSKPAKINGDWWRAPALQDVGKNG